MAAPIDARAAAGRGWIPELTSLRAVAAFAVCVTHAAFWTGGYTDDLAGRLAGRMEIGVTVFFVLSGFLLFRPWVAALAGAGGAPGAAPSARRYARHRVRRILPGYWITVLAVYLLDLRPIDVGGPHPGGAAWIDAAETGAPMAAGGWAGLLRTLTFTQSAQAGWFHAGLTQMWSMVVEVGFYLVLPLVGWAIWRLLGGRWRPVALAGCLVAFGLIGPAWAVAAHRVEALPFIARLWPMGYFDWFAGGMALAVARRAGLRAPAHLAWPLAAAALAVAATPVAGPATLVPDGLGQALAKNLVYLVFAVALIAPAALGPAAGAPAAPGLGWLRHPAPHWLGEISYEFFLVHLVVLEHVMPMLGYGAFQGSFAGALIVTTAISVPLAWGLRRVTDLITAHRGPASPWAAPLGG